MIKMRINTLLFLIILIASCGESKTDTVIEKVESDSLTFHLKPDFIDSTAKWHLINTGKFYDNLKYRQLKEERQQTKFAVIDFGRDYENRFVSSSKLYIDKNEKVFEYEKDSDSLRLYNYDESRKCDLNTLIWIDSLLKVRTLNEKDIFTLFKSTNPYCSNNAEYSQMVNEYLWKSLINNPAKFAWTLSFNTIQKEQKDFIISKIKNPINDSFHTKGLIESIEDSELEHQDTNSVKELINVLSQLK